MLNRETKLETIQAHEYKRLISFHQINNILEEENMNDTGPDKIKQLKTIILECQKEQKELEMREMKDSGIEWIGKIPEEWNITKLRFIGEYINGYAFKPADWSSEGKIIIRIQDLTGSNDSPNYYNGELPEQYLIKKEDILISWAATLGAFLWSREDTGWLNQHIFKAIPNEEMINYDYFFWLMNTAMENMNNDNKHGIVMQHVTEHVFNHFSVPLPPLPEQQSIAFLLNSKCNTVDTLKSEIEKQIEMLKQYKQSIITETVTKGLDPEVEMKDSEVEWIGSIPLHWNVTRGKYILQHIHRNAEENEEVITCFRDGEVTLRSNRRTEGFTMSDKENGYQGIEYGDLVVHGMDGFAGAIGISDSNGKGSPVLIVLNTNQNKRYIMYYLRSLSYNNVFSALSTGIRVRSCDLSWSKLAELQYLLPPLQEQQEITDYIDKLMYNIDVIISNKQKEHNLLMTYKNSLIYEYSTGKKEAFTIQMNVEKTS